MLPFQEPNKFGCSEGNVFDAETQVCKLAEEVRTNLSLKITKKSTKQTSNYNQKKTRCRNARAGTAARKTASVATTATPIVRVELLLHELDLELELTNNHLPHISLSMSLPFPLVLHLLFLTSPHFPFKTQSYTPLY